MAFLPRRMAVAVAAVASIFATFAVSAAPSYASSVPAPTLVSPANTTGTPLKDVILQWNPVPGASQYQVELSPNRNFTNNEVALPDGGITVNTLYEMPVSLPHASYFWHVRAQVGGVWSPYSVQWQFLRDWDTSIAIIKQPTDVDPTISWAPISEASMYVVNFYDIGVNDTPGDVAQATPTESCTTEQTSLTPYAVVTGSDNATGECDIEEIKLVNLHYYQWSILAYDDTTAAGVTTTFGGNPPNCGSASPECSGFLGASYTSPTAFQFIRPPVAGDQPAQIPADFDPNTTVTGLMTSWHSASNAAGVPCGTSPACPVTPTFSWNPVPGANYYKVHLYLDPLDTNEFITYTTAWPELTPRGFYLDAQAGGWYYWTVQPGDCTSGCWLDGASKECTAAGGAAGEPPSFGTIDPAVNPFLDGFQAGHVYTITLNDVNGPICVKPSAGTVTGYPNPPTPNPSSSSITFDWQAPADPGTVTFEVPTQRPSTDTTAAITINAGSSLLVGTESAPVAFGKSSGAVTLSSPANGATEHGGSVTFRWQDFLASGGVTALEARNYEIQVSKDPNFDTTVIDNPDIDLTQYTNPDAFLENGSYYWRVLAIDESGNQLTWSAVHHFTVDATAPTLSFLSPDGVGQSKNLQIQSSDRLSGINASTLKVVPEGRSLAYAIAGKMTRGATANSYIFKPAKPLGTGVTYVLVPTPGLVDGNGNPIVVDGEGVRTKQVAKGNNPGWHFSHGWHKLSSSQALSRHHHYFTAAPGRRASLTVGGSEAHLFACVGPDFGKITIAVGGHSQTVSEHQKFTRCGVEIWHRALPDTPRKLTVSVVKGVGNLDEVQVD